MTWKPALIVALATMLAVPATAAAPRATDPAVTSRITAWADSDLTALQWGPEAIGVPRAHSASTGRGVTVAVIDTGVDSSHPDLGANTDPGFTWVSRIRRGRITYRLREDSRPSIDYGDHGTHVSGIIAADADGHGTTGVAPDAHILPINIATVIALADSYAQFTPPLARSIRVAADRGARVINISLASEHTELGLDNRARTPGEKDEATGHRRLCEAVDYATGKGALVVASAGNEGASGNVSSLPADCDQALTVGAVDNRGQRAFFSSFNDQVDITAPGTSILSPVPDGVAWAGVPAYLRMDGTSMAAPHVSGVAALLFSAHPEWTAEQVAATLTRTSTDAGLPGHDVEYGDGIVNAEAALLGTGGTWRTDPHVFAPMLREAANDAGQWALTFNPPQSAVDHYELTVLRRDGTHKQYRLPPRTVATPALPSSTWALVDAVYADGQVRSGGWVPTSVAADQSRRARPQAVRAHYVDGLRRVRITWHDGTYASMADTTAVLACPADKASMETSMIGCSRLRRVSQRDVKRHRTTLAIPRSARAYDQRVQVIQAPQVSRERLLDVLMYGVWGSTVLRGRRPIVLSGVYRVNRHLFSVEGGVNSHWRHAIAPGEPVTARVRIGRRTFAGDGYVTWPRGDGVFSFGKAFVIDVPTGRRRLRLRDAHVAVRVRSRSGRTWTTAMPVAQLLN